MPSELIFNDGLIIAGVALTLGILSAVILAICWKRLSGKLDIEYGKKKR